MGTIELACWATGILVYAYLCVLAGRWAYGAAWRFTGAPDNVVAPPPPVLSSGQTSPYVPTPKVYPVSDAGLLTASSELSGMTNCVSYYLHPKGSRRNPIYTQAIPPKE